jgi:hypothetical protein
MVEYTSVTVTTEVKEELDRQRKTPMGDVSVNDFLSFLLTENAKKKR